MDSALAQRENANDPFDPICFDRWEPREGWVERVLRTSADLMEREGQGGKIPSTYKRFD